MSYYLLIYFTSLLFSVFIYDRHLRIIDNRILACIFCVFLIMLAGLRYNISTDYWNYYQEFYNPNGAERFEFLFKKILLFIKDYFYSYNLFVFVIAFIALSVKGLYFSKLNNPFLAIFIYICIYFFDSDFNIIRQGAGIGFVYFAIEEGRKGRFINYVLLILIAAGFHVSYLILLPFYFLCNKKFNFSLKKIIFFISILFIIRITFFNQLLRAIQAILRNSGNPLISQFVLYLGVGDFHINLSLLRRLFFVLLYLYLFGTDNLNIYFILYFFSFVLSLLLTGNEMFLHRLSLCFDVFSVPLFASKKIVLNKKNIVGLFMFIISLTVLYFKPMRPVLPYQSYL